MSVKQRKTPGVYIVEENAFPNSVVEVPTGIPVFVGYTEKATRGPESLIDVPTRITTLGQYEELFGGGPITIVNWDAKKLTLTMSAETRFLMHLSLQLFFRNGGSNCWIVSVGGYTTAGKPTVKSASAMLDTPLAALERVLEPSIIMAPDAVLLDIDGWAEVSNLYLNHCGTMQSRVAILDVPNGSQERTFDQLDDVVSGTNGFRGKITSDEVKFGVAYYPWVDTNLLELEDIGLNNAGPDLRKYLGELVYAGAVPNAKPGGAGDARNKKLAAMARDISDAKAMPQKLAETNRDALDVSPDYKRVMGDVLASLNRMPPGPGMAGVYARIDATDGVFRAPANTGMVSVVKPVLEISAEQQEDLNAPLGGKAVNAIRTFAGRGVLVWGARTLDANSLDWRYINVRRTLIMLEQSIKTATEAFVFAANDSSTWLSVKTMIDNFLINQWKVGALAGSKAQDAFDVSVGLGSTMTSVDILEGNMNITVRVAVLRPAEFIVITFRQKMQTS